MNPISSNQRNENLQILRFVAAALVLVTHITFYIHERIDSSFAVWHSGEIGVPIFFVISGFVMQYSSAKFLDTDRGARDFLLRRIARIIPLYWLITSVKIAIALAIPAAVLHNHPTLTSSLGSFFLLPMFNAAGEVRPIHGVAWTLLHEMVFYYIFAIAIFLKRSPVVWCSATIIALWLLGYSINQKTALMIVLTDTINLMFVAGILLAWSFQKEFRLPPALAAILLIGSLAAIFSDEFTSIKRMYLHNIHWEAVILVLALLNMDSFGHARIKRLFSSLGDSSYSLYLIHPILAPAVLLVLAKIGISNVITLITSTVILAVSCSVLIFIFVESPLNRKASTLLGIGTHKAPSTER